jgi:hypothetical protein
VSAGLGVALLARSAAAGPGPAIGVCELARSPEHPWPPQERQPSRQSQQSPEPWPDEDEAEQTAWGFFMWDD